MSISLYSWCIFGTTFKMDLRLVCCRVIRMKLSKCWDVYPLSMCFCLFIPSFFGSNIKYDVSLPTKKVTGILLLIVFRAVYFPLVNLLIKMQKIKSVQSIYTSVAICYLYAVFQSNYFALAAKEHQRLLSIANTVRIFNYQSGIQVLIPTC